MNYEKINLLKEYVPTLSDNQLEQFIKYYEMLIEKNRVMNLTAITDFEEVVVKHFADSLAIVRDERVTQNDNKNYKILDIGTGAGFPGIPLKIAYPDADITLLDSLGKRVDFLNDVIDALDLNKSGKICAVHSRAEDFIKEQNNRESYDLVVSRAVAALNILSEYALPYVKLNEYFIAYKSEKSEEEINDSKKAIELLGGEVVSTDTFILPDSDIGRTLIVIRKTRPTPDKYPRRAGLPSKKPL